MKIAAFSNGGGRKLGLVVTNGIIDIGRHLEGAPSDMIGLMEVWELWRPQLMELANIEADYPLDRVTLHAPVPRPGKVMVHGINYVDHGIEADMEMPKEQMWCSKVVTSVADPYGDIQLPKVSTFLDYEVELVAVIGKRCRHVAKEDAADMVFGYCVGNDVSVRDWQNKTSQFTIGKAFDTHAPFGPWIVTADEINPHADGLGIRCWVNGEERQNSNTRLMINTSFDMVAFLSQAMTLEPGDIFFTGTPAGVGAAMKPPVYLKDGDTVRSEIEGIGVIENVVRAEI